MTTIQAKWVACAALLALVGSPCVADESESETTASQRAGQADGQTVTLTFTQTWSSPADPGVSAGSSGDAALYAYGAVDPLCPSGKRSVRPVTIEGLDKELMVCLDAPVTQAPAGAPVVVTGATGFIGRHLVAGLEARDLARGGQHRLVRPRAPVGVGQAHRPLIG